MEIVRKILQEHSLNKYAKLSVKEKDTKKKYGRERYWNMSEEGKQKLKEYQQTIVT